MFTPPKLTMRCTNLDETPLINTPRPRATSTVLRKSALDDKVLPNNVKEDLYIQTLAFDNDSVEKISNESSLGLLDNVSMLLNDTNRTYDNGKLNLNEMDANKELARKLLQRCSDFKVQSMLSETNKENNANAQNTVDNTSTTPIDTSINTTVSITMQPENTPDVPKEKTRASSVVFEPNEISARSSGKSRESGNAENHSTASQNNMGRISIDAATAELMAQFNNEEFCSTSQMTNRLLADELSWQQNCSYAVPVTTNTEREYLDLSCFSGLIGDLDLSVESCAGRKLSVGQFFKRKCGNIGELSDDALRPSFGLSVASPKKSGKAVPLVECTMITEAPSIRKEKDGLICSNLTKDVEEHSIMSLSSIAQALQDIDNGTPRKLVDQLIMAKKQKKYSHVSDKNISSGTYTILPSNRQSLPATPTTNPVSFKQDNELNVATKLSLDNKRINETADAKYTLSRKLSYNYNIGRIMKENGKKEDTNKTTKSSSQDDADKKSLLKNVPADLIPILENSTLFRSSSNVDTQLNNQKDSINHNVHRTKQEHVVTHKTETKSHVKQENVSHKSKENSAITPECSTTQLFGPQSNSNCGVTIGRNTEDLCNCIIGMTRETDIELLNGSDRWIICSINLCQLQGDKQSIILGMPKDIILMKPNSSQSLKIDVKIIKMCKPIIAVLNIIASDMVTHAKWIIRHIICFKPEDLNINVQTNSDKEELVFQSMIDNSMMTVPLTLKNNNSISLPIKLSILKDMEKLFVIGSLTSDVTNTEKSHNNVEYITLKSQEQYTTHIQLKSSLSDNVSGSHEETPYIGPKLLIQVENQDGDLLTIKELPLILHVDTCKIQIVNTEMPIIIPIRQSKPLSIINSGSVPVTVNACIEHEDSQKSVKNFNVKPSNMYLSCNEVGTFVITYKQHTSNLLTTESYRQVRIKLSAGDNTYYYSVMGVQDCSTEPESCSLLRSETPQHLIPISSPTSPQSITLNRNSPSSSVSSSTVAGDKIPIRATHAALVWNSVKAGKGDIKEFTIRNTSDNKIKIQALISDNDKNFKFLRERKAVGTNIVLPLQRMESRTLSVIFTPNRIGASVGKITFKHYESKKDNTDPRVSKVIYLYGYGGYGKIEISEAFKDISGKMWLSLGTLNSGGSLNAKIKLQNTGNLTSYAKIKLTPKAVYPSMVSSWHVNPTEFILNSKESQWVTLEFNPRKEDLALLRHSDISHVGTLTITHGDEPTRLRIRRLYNKMKEIGEFCSSDSEAFRNIVYPICRAFPNEQLISDLNIIRDSVQNLSDLCHGVHQHEIMLTMEKCADETLSALQDNADDSQMFYSLCSDNSHTYELCGDSYLPSETMGFHDNMYNARIYNDNFVVSPTVVNLTPPAKYEAIVMIMSSCRVAQPYETVLSNEDLTVVPAEGMIPTGRGFPLKIQCKHQVLRNFEAILEIYTENNKQEVLIKVNTKRQ